MAPAKRELVFSYPQRSLQRYKYEDVCVCVREWGRGWNHGKLGPNSVGKFKKLIK